MLPTARPTPDPAQPSADPSPRARAYIEGALRLAVDHPVSVDVVDVLVSEDRVALLVDERFSTPSGTVELRRSNVPRVARGRIVEVTIYEGDQDAADRLFADVPPLVASGGA